MPRRSNDLTRAGLMLLFCVGLAAAARAEETVRLLPGDFTLSGQAARQSLVLETFVDDRATGQLTDSVTFTTSDPAVVKLDGAVALPVANGTATLTATAGERSAAVTVNVVDFEQPFEWSFRNHVESVLSKAGCNTGACHGALAGKKGFKLSLGAFDPLADYFYITRQARARRIVLSDPGRSLVLTKPTGAVPHKGGVRFEVDSPEYKVLADWIAAGAHGPQDDDPRIVRLELLPRASVVQPGAQQQLIVRAHFSDGRVEDVTRWARYTSTNESVATVGDQGLVQVAGQGEAAIKAWYLSQNVIATVSVAYDQQVDPAVFAKAPRRNFIDELVLAKLDKPEPPPFSAGGRCRVLTPRLRRHDRTCCRPSKKREHFWPTRRPTSATGWSTNCSRGPSSSTTGLTSGATCCWSTARSCLGRPCGATTTGFAITWRRTHRGTSLPGNSSPPAAARWKTAPPISSCCTRILRSWPKPCRWRSWACRSTAPSATTIRWKNGPTTSITAWPTCSPACVRRWRPAPATALSTR